MQYRRLESTDSNRYQRLSRLRELKIGQIENSFKSLIVSSELS